METPPRNDSWASIPFTSTDQNSQVPVIPTTPLRGQRRPSTPRGRKSSRSAKMVSKLQDSEANWQLIYTIVAMARDESSSLSYGDDDDDNDDYDDEKSHESLENSNFVSNEEAALSAIRVALLNNATLRVQLEEDLGGVDCTDGTAIYMVFSEAERCGLAADAAAAITGVASSSTIGGPGGRFFRAYHRHIAAYRHASRRRMATRAWRAAEGMIRVAMSMPLLGWCLQVAEWLTDVCICIILAIVAVLLPSRLLRCGDSVLKACLGTDATSLNDERRLGLAYVLRQEQLLRQQQGSRTATGRNQQPTQSSRRVLRGVASRCFELCSDFDDIFDADAVDFLLLLLHSRTLSLASEAIDNPWETAQACYRFMRWVGVSLVAAVFRRGVCATIREIRAFVLHFLQEARSNSDWIRERELKEHNRSRGRSWEWSSLGSSHAGSAPGSPDPEPLQ